MTIVLRRIQLKVSNKCNILLYIYIFILCTYHVLSTYVNFNKNAGFLLPEDKCREKNKY